MSEENLEAVKNIYERWASGDFRAGAAELDPYVMFVVERAFPENGAFVGPSDVERFMRRFFEQYKRFRLEAQSLRVAGDTILAKVLQHAEGRTSGIDIETTYFMLFTFRGGKIIRMETLMEEADALAAAGLAE